MTAEALSPPNPAESLRERLIREGKIVPAQNSTASLSSGKTAHQHLFELIEKLNAAIGENFLEEYRDKFIHDNYLKVLQYFNKSAGINDSGFSVGTEKVVIDYYFALSVKHLKIIYFAFNSFGKLLSNRVVILRSGFFFAFKENMKNTP